VPFRAPKVDRLPPVTPLPPKSEWIVLRELFHSKGEGVVLIFPDKCNDANFIVMCVDCGFVRKNILIVEVQCIQRVLYDQRYNHFEAISSMYYS
jgi:hypothetical protein